MYTNINIEMVQKMLEEILPSSKIIEYNSLQNLVTDDDLIFLFIEMSVHELRHQS